MHTGIASPASPTLPPALLPSETAFFLDVDGTLAEIVADPAQACIPPDALTTLKALSDAAGGALALVSGRSIAQLDAMLHPLVLPVAGVHGLERRDFDGRVSRMVVDTAAHRRLVSAVDSFASTRPGLQTEEKPGSVALHFRNRPELGADCLHFMNTECNGDSRLTLVQGKMVAELKFGSRDKRQAIADFMNEHPFRGRRPFFAGDDVTDEAGFAGVNALGGISVKVGSGDSAAHFRLADPAALAGWLARLLASRAPARGPAGEQERG
ncbi:trehalose-phosphatase [Pararhodobacter sp.]|uniref:trehalose-phosphatase n=1 Tax=Pararhodobacter sp. TaxID=2127056 RepID=UPI002FDD70C8